MKNLRICLNCSLVFISLFLFPACSKKGKTTSFGLPNIENTVLFYGLKGPVKSYEDSTFLKSSRSKSIKNGPWSRRPSLCMIETNYKAEFDKEGYVTAKYFYRGVLTITDASVKNGRGSNTYFYDEDYNLLKIEYSSEGKNVTEPWGKRIYNYNARGLETLTVGYELTDNIMVARDSSLTEYNEYGYTTGLGKFYYREFESKKMITKEVSDKYLFTYEYNDGKKAIRQFNKEGKITKSWEYLDGQMVIEKIHFNPSVIDASVYHPNGVLDYKQSQYPNGPILEKKNNAGHWLQCSDIVFEYPEFDTYGNWVKRYAYITFGYKPKELVKITTRHIEYHR